MRLICLIGTDGAGKTWYCKRLVKKLGAKYVWFRFNHFFSLPLLAYARIVGLSTGNTHNFWKSPLFARLYVKTQVIDNKLAIFLRLRGDSIVCDRFIHDTIIDLHLSTRIPLKRLIKTFRPLIPKNALVVLVSADIKTLKARRPDDQFINQKVKLYEQLAREMKLPTKFSIVIT